MRQMRNTPVIAQKFHRRLVRALFRYHWLLPYPSDESLTQPNKNGDRMWYSIENKWDSIDSEA